ncbi:uncharacterized protein LOC134857080 isoform X2 [Symsagittifera roscoffensis]|uniref:uncharacterized protein LOC134857080 isoform X2 n=1 Tax=Symsagittifera roscoffensis TaxID=84072 RepID=UPI00307C4C31
MVSGLAYDSNKSQRPPNSADEPDLFLRPYAQDDLISLRSEDEMAGVMNGGMGGDGVGGGGENDLLRPIFDAIDTEGRDFITLDKFFEEMDRYSNTPMSANKKERLQKTLDPDNQGIVTYPNFVTGVLMFRLEENNDAMSAEEAGYEQLVNEWTTVDQNSDELSNAATNWSTHGDLESPEDLLGTEFENTLTAKNSQQSGGPFKGIKKSHSINDRFKGQDLPYSAHNGHQPRRAVTPGGAIGGGGGGERGDRSQSRTLQSDPLFDPEEEVYSTYSDLDNNDDALSTSSANNPHYTNTSYRFNDDYDDGMNYYTIPRITRGRGVDLEHELNSFNPMRLNGHKGAGVHPHDVMDCPGPSNLLSSRSMSEADRRKREITAPHPLSLPNALSTRRTSVPFNVPRPSARSRFDSPSSREYGHRRANSNMSNISRSPRPRSPGGNSAVDDACSHLSESDACMLDHKIRSLQQQLENYVSGRAESEAVQLKLREDKNNFQNRSLMLEEQLSEVKRSHEDEVRHLKMSHREERQALERDSREKVEQLREQMRELEHSSQENKAQVPRLTGQLELLKEDKQKLEDKVDARDHSISQLEVKLARLEEEKERIEEALHAKLTNLQQEHRQLQQEYEAKILSRSPSRQGNFTVKAGGSFTHDQEGGDQDAKVTEMIHKCNLLRNENSKLIEKIHELESSYRYLESRKTLCDNCRLPLSGRASVDAAVLSDQSKHRDTTGGSLESLEDVLPLDPESSNSPLPTCTRTPPPHSTAHQPTTSQGAPRSLAAELAQVMNRPREIDLSKVVKDALEQNKSYETICFELKQQEQINDDLQNYLSRLLLLIMESNPEILEVK